MTVRMPPDLTLLMVIERSELDGEEVRSLTTVNEAANIQYIQFWLMDPFTPDGSGHPSIKYDSENHQGGDFYINIGNISEDIIKDAKSFENGNSTDGSLDTTTNKKQI